MDTIIDISPAKLPLTLKTTNDWDKWYFYIKDTSNIAKVWQYIDPSVDIERINEEPTSPAYSDVREDATTWSSLDADEREHYKTLVRRYEKQEAEYQKKDKGISRVNAIINSSVDTSYWVILRNATTPYQKLKALQRYLAPSSLGRERQIRKDYQTVINQRITNPELWLMQWTKAHRDAIDIGLPDVQGDRDLEDFLTAVEPFAPDFVHTVQTTIIQQTNRFSLLEIVEQFREARRRAKIPQTRVNHAAFSGQQQNDKGQEKRIHKEPPCICGLYHYWDKCFYLNDKLTPHPGFRRRPEIEEKIKERLTNDPGLRDRIDARIQTFSRQPKASKPNKEREDDDDTLGAYTTAVYSASREYKLKNHWILDSGSDIHVTNHRNGYQETSKASIDDRLIAGTSTHQIKSFGTIKVPVQTPTGQKSITLLRVAYIPTFMTNLVALSKLVEKGLHWDTERGTLRREGKDLCYIHRLGGHWTLTTTPLDTDDSTKVGNVFSATKAPKQATLKEWHRILGHANYESLRHLSTETKGVMVTNTESPESCDPCRLGKATQLISRDSDQERPAKGPFDRVSWDLIPMQEGFNGDRYVSHFKCFYTGMNHVYTQQDKSSTLRTVRQYLKYVEVHYKAQVKFIRLDGETSLGKEFIELTKERGIFIERSAVATQAQNGNAERSGRTIITMARTMRIQANLPSNLWPELVKAAGYYINRLPTKRLGWKTPFEMAHGDKPSLSHFHPIGCKAFIHLKGIPRLKKMDPRSQIGYLVGYNSTNQWRIWEPRSGQIKSVRDVIFDDKAVYHPNDMPLPALLNSIPKDEPVPLYSNELIVETTQPPLQDTIEIDIPFRVAPTCQETQEEESTIKELLTQEQMPWPTPEPSPEPPSQREEGEINESSSTGPQELSLRAISNRNSTTGAGAPPPANTERQEREIGVEFNESNILPEGARRTRKPRRQAYITTCDEAKEGSIDSYYSAFAVGATMKTGNRYHRDDLPPEPRHWRDMTNHPFYNEFMDAATKEWTTLVQKGTFQEQEKQDIRAKALPLMWVFKYKLNEDGYLDKFKARVCVRGDLQQSNDDNYAATLACKTFRALMAITASEDLEMIQVDAVNAFLNSKIDQEIYIQYPEGFQQGNKVLRLIKALYGLKRSPLLWYQELTTTLKQLGLKEISEMNCVMANEHGIVFFYVDDIIFLYKESNRRYIEQLLTQLQERYQLRIMQRANWFLGIRILRNRATKQLWLCQDSYIDKITTRFHISKVRKALITPLPTEKISPNQEKARAQDINLYQQKVGSINFATTMTRPDIAFATSKLSQFLLNPSTTHQSLADRVLTYLGGTRTHALQLTGQKEMELSIYTDSSFADCPDRKSSQGYLVYLGNNLIDWKSSKQATVTTSSTEAELLAFTTAAREALHWQRSLNSLISHFTAASTVKITTQIQLLVDNQQTIGLLTKPQFQLQTKLRHVDIHGHWARQEVQDGNLTVKWVKTASMNADGLTKALTRNKHADFMRRLNLIAINVD